MNMPAIRQCVSPNYTPSPIAHNLIFVHMMEGGAAGSAAYLCLSSTRASAHLCMSEDGSLVYQLVPLQYKAWAQCSYNGLGISLEIPGFTAQGIPEARWRSAALIVAWLCHAYGIPPVWAPNGQGRGVCQHHDLGAAGGGHVDCSGVGSPTWLAFMGYVKEAFDAMPMPLPAWALHGAPAPHAVELPPNVTPEPSHEGADRSEQGAIAYHPTASNYPAGSAADMQWRLNKAGASPQLIIDGLAGNATRRALTAFQSSHGLDADGMIGPLTWAALEKATS